MGYLEKNFLLHERDEKGQLLPIEYPCPELDGRVLLVKPAPRGKILRVFNEAGRAIKQNNQKKHDRIMAEFAAEYILNPKTDKPLFTSEELLSDAVKTIRYKDKDGSPKFYRAWDLFVTVIYKISGVDIEGKDKKPIEKQEKDLKKNVNK